MSVTPANIMRELRADCYYDPAKAVAADLIEHMEHVLSGMVGLVDLLLARDDLPPAIREVLATNHRVIAAKGCLIALATDQPPVTK